MLTDTPHAGLYKALWGITFYPTFPHLGVSICSEHLGLQAATFSYVVKLRCWSASLSILSYPFYYIHLLEICGHWQFSPPVTLIGSPGSSAGKESTCKAGDPGSIPGLGRSTGEGIGYPLQYSWASLGAQVAKNLPAIWETCYFKCSGPSAFWTSLFFISEESWEGCADLELEVCLLEERRDALRETDSQNLTRRGVGRGLWGGHPWPSGR